jgi:hypothetical protein
MSKRETRTLEEQEAEIRQRYIDAREERLDAPLTRRDVLAAIDEVVSEYSGSGMTDQDLIADAFRKLARALQ